MISLALWHRVHKSAQAYECLKNALQKASFHFSSSLIIILKMNSLTIDELATSAQEKGFTLSNKNPGRVKATYRCSKTKQDCNY